MEPDKFESLAKDPVFVKAARSLVWNRKQAEAASEGGVDRSPPIPLEDKSVQAWTKGKYRRADIDAWLAEAAKPSAQNVLQGIGQGITFNFLDELRGAAKGKTARDAMRLKQAAFEEQNPGKELASEGAGAAINPVSLALAAATGGSSEFASPLLQKLGLSKLPSLVKAAAVGVPVGATEGALYGAGAGEDAPERLVKAKQGAEMGAATGLVLPAAGAARNLLKSTFATPAERAAQRVAADVTAAGGRDAIIAHATDATDLANTLPPGPGREAMQPVLGDAPGMYGTHELAANSDPATNMATRALARARKDATPGLLRGILRNLVPEGTSTDMGSTLDAMGAARRAQFDPAYAAMGDAQAQGLAGSGPADRVLGHVPTVAEVAADAAHPQNARALALAANGPKTQALPMPGVAPVPPEPAYVNFAQALKQDPTYFGKAWRKVLNADAINGAANIGRPTVQMLRDMRRTLQDDVEELFRSGRNNDALELKQRMGIVNDALDNETGGVGKSVDAQYRAHMDAERAVEDGRKWYYSQTVDKTPTSIAGLKAKLAVMTPEELDGFRTGVASSVNGDLEHAAVNQNVAAGLRNASDFRKSLISTIFPDSKTLAHYEQMVETAGQQAQLGQSTAQSATARIQAGQAGAEPTLGLSDLQSPGAILNKVATSAAGTAVPARQAFGSAVGKLTMTRGTPTIDAALKKLLEPPGAVPSFLSSPGAAAGMGTAGAVAGSQP